VSDVLTSSTFDTMTERPSIPDWRGEDSYYGMGLYVRPEPDHWWHTGSLPGTSAIMVRAGRDGLGWAALMNSRPQNWGEFNTALDKTLWAPSKASRTGRTGISSSGFVFSYLISHLCW